jgi:hypothetical protein
VVVDYDSSSSSIYQAVATNYDDFFYDRVIENFVELPMDAHRASTVKNAVTLLSICRIDASGLEIDADMIKSLNDPLHRGNRLESPCKYQSSSKKATLDSPSEYYDSHYTLGVRLLEMWVVNIETGDVYMKLRPKDGQLRTLSVR